MRLTSVDSRAGKIHIGTAGWTIPKDFTHHFTSAGSHLERYARTLNSVEINSAFHREHKPETYARWAASVPEDFRFAVKLRKRFTHESKLRDTTGLGETLVGISELGPKLGALLVQLPPSLKFERDVAEEFFGGLRDLFEGAVALEPRHPSWINEEALRTLAEFRISKVMADPEPCPLPRERRERVMEIAYFRLHGSPEMYKSPYGTDLLERISKALTRESVAGRETWCIFDNTTFGFATDNAVEVRARLQATGLPDHMASFPTRDFRSST